MENESLPSASILRSVGVNPGPERAAEVRSAVLKQGDGPELHLGIPGQPPTASNSPQLCRMHIATVNCERIVKNTVANARHGLN